MRNMKTCPNPKCKTTGIPDEAKFCPNCGTMLQKEEPAKRMIISECHLVPNFIKKGEQCRLVWKGDNVKNIIVNDQHYNATDDIFLSPSQSQPYNVIFIGDNTIISLNAEVKVETPYLFGERGQEKYLNGEPFCIQADARQLVRTSGSGMQGRYCFNGGINVSRYVKYFLSGDYPQITISIGSNGMLSEIKYEGTKRSGEGYTRPHITVFFAERVSESGLIIKKKNYTGIMYRSLTHICFGHQFISEQEWMKNYGNEFHTFCDQHLPLLKKIFGIDPIYENPFWRW